MFIGRQLGTSYSIHLSDFATVCVDYDWSKQRVRRGVLCPPVLKSLTLAARVLEHNVTMKALSCYIAYDTLPVGVRETT